MKHTSPNNNMMKIGFFTPYIHSHRGNSITARRIVSGLRKDGFLVEVFAYDEDDWNQQAQHHMETCDLFHILHFHRFAKWQKSNKFTIKKPYVLTSGGTDVNEKLGDLSSERLLSGAAAVTVFTKKAGEKLTNTFPELNDKVEVVPQSILVPDWKDPLEKELPNGYPKVLLPSGVRRVKDVFYLTDMLETIVNHYPELQFVIVGEAIEPDEVERVRDFQRRHGWFTYIGSVSIESMYSIYEWADVVLNTSISEGQPIALMEAMYYGKPVLARRNTGNESLITNGEHGFLFDDQMEFRNQLTRLLNDKNLYEQVSQKGKEWIFENFSLGKEIQQYTQIYQYIRGEH